MKNKVIFFLGLLLLATSAWSQQRISSFHEEKTEKWTVKIYGNDPLAVREYTLKNGMTVITSVNKAQPRIYTMVAVKTGSKNDPANNTGLAHYLEHMLFKGTDKYGTLDWEKEKVLLAQVDALYETYNKTTDENARKSIYRSIDSVSQLAAKFAIANEYDKMCQAMGASGTNAFTSNEQTVYINDIPSNMLHKWMELEAERFRNPVLRLFHTELEAVYEEKNIGLDNDIQKVWEKLYAELFEKHNYGLQTTIGTIEHLKNPSLIAIREYYQKYYVPNNMAIVLSGDFDPNAAADGIAEHFKYMTAAPVTPYTFEYEMPHAAPQKFDIYGQDAEYIMIGFRLPGVNTREARAARLIDLLLNNSSAGLIDLNLVKKQRVLSANTSVDIMNDYSVFVMNGKPKEGQTLEEVRDLLMEQMQNIVNGNFDAELLKSILLNEEINKIAAFKDNANRSNFLMQAFVNGMDYQHAYNELWEMQKMSKEDIQEIAKEFLQNDRIEIYKRMGEDTSIRKIAKPEIHPVELNRDKQSEFVTKWLAEETSPIAPVFADFKGKIQQSKVGNIPLYYVKNADNRLFTVEYRYDYGKLHNKTLPLALSFLSLAGTAKMSAEEISRKMYSLGCRFSASSDDKRCYINLYGPEENFDAAVEILEDLLANIQPDQTAFQGLIENEKKRREDAKHNNRVIASKLSQYALYGPVNPGNWVLTDAQLNALKAEDLVAIISGLAAKKHNISYYGQRSQDAVAQTLLNKHKGGKMEETPLTVEFLPRENKENEVLFVNYDMVQANIYWASKGTAQNIQETPLILAFNQYFGGDMSSVVFQNIRESKALAYSTYAFYNTARYASKPNSVIAFVGTQADKFNDAVGAMNELLQTLPKDENVFILSLESLKNQLETERVDDENLVDYYFQMADLGSADRDLNELNYQALSGLTLEKIAEFHKTRLSGKNYTYAVLGNKEKIKTADLAKLGKVKELTLEEIYGY